jgi:hypothetical protein
MAVSGHRDRKVFERYNVSDTRDVVNAMRAVEKRALGEKSVKMIRGTAENVA